MVFLSQTNKRTNDQMNACYSYLSNKKIKMKKKKRRESRCDKHEKSSVLYRLVDEKKIKSVMREWW